MEARVEARLTADNLRNSKRAGRMKVTASTASMASTAVAGDGAKCTSKLNLTPAAVQPAVRATPATVERSLIARVPLPAPTLVAKTRPAPSPAARAPPAAMELLFQHQSTSNGSLIDENRGEDIRQPKMEEAG